MKYLFIYWTQNLSSAEPQQILFAMALPSCATRGLRWQRGIATSI